MRVFEEEVVVDEDEELYDYNGVGGLFIDDILYDQG